MLSAYAAILLLSTTLPGADRNEVYQPRSGDFTIVCTLFNGDKIPRGARPGEIPITYDANIVIGGRVERVVFGKSPWEPKTTLRFLIHSPALMFGGDDFSGKQFKMTFSPFRPKTKEDLIWFDPSMRYILRALSPAVPDPVASGGDVPNLFTPRTAAPPRSPAWPVRGRRASC